MGSIQLWLLLLKSWWSFLYYLVYYHNYHYQKVFYIKSNTLIPNLKLFLQLEKPLQVFKNLKSFLRCLKNVWKKSKKPLEVFWMSKKSLKKVMIECIMNENIIKIPWGPQKWLDNLNNNCLHNCILTDLPRLITLLIITAKSLPLSTV